MDVKEFLNKVFLRDIREMIGRFNYISFPLIILGIEFLGACLDAYPWEEKQMSGKRIRLSIKELFPEHYYNNVEKILKLRNSFAHYFSPQFGIILTHKAEWPHKEITHLKIFQGKTVFIVENFYIDFADACDKVIAKIDQKQISNKKVYNDFLQTTTQ